MTTPNPLRAYLDEVGETAAAFAARIEVSPSFLSRLISGEREADATILSAIGEATGGRVPPNAWVAWWDVVQTSSDAAA